MASADLGDELLCSICLNIYTDPVTLRCGHNFCRDCIGRVLNIQDGAGGYSCPECKEQSQKRPALKTNTTLRNIVENFLSTRPHQEEITGIFCTYCVDSAVPAVRSCLHCEASLCDKHLKVHSKGPDHVLTDPTITDSTKKCSVHKKVLEYYCTEDSTCICVCCAAGEHRGHRVEKLDEDSEEKKKKKKKKKKRTMNKKKKLRNVLQNLITKREKTEERVRSLGEQWRKARITTSGETERVTALFIAIRRRLDDLEKRILGEISRQEEKMSLSLSDVFQKLEIKKDELSRKIEELCNMADPLTVLQGPDTGDLCDPEEGGGDEDTGGHDTTHDVDVDVITEMLHAGLSDIVKYLQTISPPKPKRPQPPGVRSLSSHTQASPVAGPQYGGDGVIVRTGGEGAAAGEGGVYGGEGAAAGEGGVYEGEGAGKEGVYGQGPADILLDVNTANNNLLISDDMKTASWTNTWQNRPDTAERFEEYYPQVMSGGGFSSGRHYWDVEIRASEEWRVGMCYPSIDRRGDRSLIGHNNNSWCLYKKFMFDQWIFLHDSNGIPFPHQISSNRVRICLDYEAGQLSFYELCDPIRHLHTFTTTFTEPLHAVLYVLEDSIKILGGGATVRSHRGNLPRDK